MVAAGLTLSAIVALVVTPRLLEGEHAPPVRVAEGTAVRNSVRIPPDLDWRGAQKDLAAFPDCLGRDVSHCIVVEGSGLHVLLVGDSTGRVLPPRSRTSRIASR